MLLTTVYAVTRRLLSLPALLFRSDVSKEAELLVLRHENAVPRRQSHGCAVSRPIACGWRRRPGRPPTAAAVRAPALRMAADNPTWGHRRIHGELTRLGHKIAASWNILNQTGIDPAPRRSGPTWKQFLAAQAEHIVAVDFLHVDAINLKRIYALVLFKHRSRRAHLLGVTANPTGEWTTQAARNFLMDTDTTNIKFLIRDRAGQFTDAFNTVFADAGLHVLKSPPQAPKANAHCERMIGTLRRELLDRTLILNEQRLRRTLTRYLERYNSARPHRGIGQLSPSQAEAGPPSPVDLASHRVHRRTILGGLINEYRIAI
ncbi:integrase-like protein [Nonomuraea fuscirosea]|uniref:Integrase-like protein n=1 Tax=Nonomuraea fuscirosea TaxID=1291556 RepID=A0A2T0MYE8_9ACTN|nr:integrase-like protein [Nonomuraea fuscirosea]